MFHWNELGHIHNTKWKVSSYCSNQVVEEQQVIPERKKGGFTSNTKEHILSLKGQTFVLKQQSSGRMDVTPPVFTGLKISDSRRAFSASAEGKDPQSCANNHRFTGLLRPSDIASNII